MAKKYYWLKLKEDFFRKREIKKLRTIAGGDTFTIIYLKLQLLSLKNEGTLYFEGIEETFAEEMALELDEDVENVKVTFMYLEKHGLLQVINSDEYQVPAAIECTGSEVDSASRVRKHREKKSLQCNSEVTNCNTELEKELELKKELEKDKKTKSVDSQNKFSEDSPQVELSEYLYSKIRAIDPNAKRPNIQMWANHVDKLLRIDKRSKEEIENVIDYCQADSFWQSNILSTKKLREKFQTLYLQSGKNGKNESEDNYEKAKRLLARQKGEC